VGKFAAFVERFKDTRTPLETPLPEYTDLCYGLAIEGFSGQILTFFCSFLIPTENMGNAAV